MDTNYKVLFEPMKIGSVEVKNKFFMAPMATIVQTDEDNSYTTQSTDYYVARAKGGVGLIITGANWVENTVEPHAPCSFPCPTKLPIKYEHQAKELTDRCHAFGTKVFLQLTAGLGRSALPQFRLPQGHGGAHRNFQPLAAQCDLPGAENRRNRSHCESFWTSRPHCQKQRL